MSWEGEFVMKKYLMIHALRRDLLDYDIARVDIRLAITGHKEE